MLLFNSRIILIKILIHSTWWKLWCLSSMKRGKWFGTIICLQLYLPIPKLVPHPVGYIFLPKMDVLSLACFILHTVVLSVLTKCFPKVDVLVVIGQNQNELPRVHKFSQKQGEAWDDVHFLKISFSRHLNRNLKFECNCSSRFVLQVGSFMCKWGLRV